MYSQMKMLSDILEEQNKKNEEKDKIILDLVAQVSRNQLESEHRVLHSVH